MPPEPTDEESIIVGMREKVTENFAPPPPPPYVEEGHAVCQAEQLPLVRFAKETKQMLPPPPPPPVITAVTLQPPAGAV